MSKDLTHVLLEAQDEKNLSAKKVFEEMAKIFPEFGEMPKNKGW